MDLVFNCPFCDQELEVDASAAGEEIACPACSKPILIPEADARSLRAPKPPEPTAAPKGGLPKPFSVPLRSGPSEDLIQKPRPPLEVASKESDRKLRVKTIRHTDCVEVGKDRFDEMVADWLEKIGQANIISLHPISYSHTDGGSQHPVNDYGLMIIFRG